MMNSHNPPNQSFWLSWFTLILVICGSPAFSQDIIVCGFTGTEPASNTPWTQTTFLAPDLTFSGWDLGPGANPTAGINDAMGFYVVTSTPDSTLADALADDEYLHFTLTPTGNPLDLNAKRINFSIQRIDWHAPMKYALFASIDGFLLGSELFTTTTTGNGNFDVIDYSCILPLSGFDNITDPIEFRLYAFEAEYAHHDTSLTAFSIVDTGAIYTLNIAADDGGSAMSVPEGTLYEEGSIVQLLAAPEPGYTFSGWSGDVIGLGNPRTIIMDADKSITAHFDAVSPPEMILGTNLAGISDWTTAWNFVDEFKMTREWLTRTVDGSEWDSGQHDYIPMDLNEYPLELPFYSPDDENDHYVHTLMPAHVAGDYTVILEGTGSIQFWGAVSRINFQPDGGTSIYTITVPSGEEGALFLNIFESSSTDPIHDIRVIRPGFETTYDTEPFHPLFLERLSPFGNLRFMDWGETNGSSLVQWSQRTTADSYTQTRDEGASLEHMIQLANRLQQDLWYCIPHQVDDTYISQAAQLIRDTLDTHLKLYLEYSNETWNSAGAFSQTRYVQDQGEALGLAPDRWTAGQYYCSLRSVQIWEIFQDVFVDDSRLVKVMATQSASTNITNLRFEALNNSAINPEYIMPDALAIAPYFGTTYSMDDIPPIAPAYPALNDILDVTAPTTIQNVQTHVMNQKAIANTQGCRLICYEGGQHFVGIYGAENDDTLTGILHEANADPRMYSLYTDYLTMLEQEGVDLFSNFSFVSAWSKWGSWGVLEFQDQDIDVAHKYRALLEFGQECLHHGDVDMSGDVTAGDAQQTFLITLGVVVPTYVESCAADCNGDGDVTAGDAQLIFQSVIGMGACVD